MMPERTTRISKSEDSDQMKSFVRDQVDDLLKRTYAQAETDVDQARQEHIENVDRERDISVSLNR